MNITVINKDGKINAFTDQKDSLVEDVITAVVSGQGFHLVGPRGLIAYGPGSVARVGFTEKKEET